MSTPPNRGSECYGSQDDRIDPRGQSGQEVDSVSRVVDSVSTQHAAIQEAGGG